MRPSQPPGKREALLFGLLWLVLLWGAVRPGEPLCETDAQCAELCRVLGEDCDGGPEGVR